MKSDRALVWPKFSFCLDLVPLPSVTPELFHRVQEVSSSAAVNHAGFPGADIGWVRRPSLALQFAEVARRGLGRRDSHLVRGEEF